MAKESTSQTDMYGKEESVCQGTGGEGGRLGPAEKLGGRGRLIKWGNRRGPGTHRLDKDESQVLGRGGAGEVFANPMTKIPPPSWKLPN